MADIVAQGELAHLPAERVWVELEKALGERNPEVFVKVLRDCGALQKLLPEVEALFGVPQPGAHHPEIDTGIHILMALQQAALLAADTDVRFAVLLHDVGKGTTPRAEWPRHLRHEQRGVQLVEQICQRLRAPRRHSDLARARRHSDLARAVCLYHAHCHRALELRGKTLLKLLIATDALRRPDRFEAFLLACEADARGRLGLEQREYPQRNYLRQALAAAQAVSAEQFSDSGLSGKALGEAINAQRTNVLERLRPA
jgi:tRNA nucleotidyltransferase (CCA-adding enzyme)